MSTIGNTQAPTVFRGPDALATRKELRDAILSLSGDIISILTGPHGEQLSVDGYIPWAFKEDGSLDVDLLFPEVKEVLSSAIGIGINQNGEFVQDHCEMINFAGNYVFINQNENGGVTVEIRPPEDGEYSHFNSSDGFSPAKVQCSTEFSDMIIPDASNAEYDAQVYGNWVPGSIHKGFNWNETTYHPVEFYTDGYVTTSTLSSFFEIEVFDSNANKLVSLKSQPISESLLKVPLAGGQHMHVVLSIEDFQTVQEGEVYIFKPRFKINMFGLLGEAGGRFKVKIVHQNNPFVNTFLSEDYFMNCGKKPTLTTPYYQLVESSSLHPFASKWCSGLRYMTDGAVQFVVNSVNYLNADAAVETKFMANIASFEDYTYDIDDLKTYDLDVNNVCRFSKKIEVKDNIFKNVPDTITYQAENAWSKSEVLSSSVRCLIDTRKNLEDSTLTRETFKDESYRVYSDFLRDPEMMTDDNFIAWNSKVSLEVEDEGQGLMVIPGVGVCYPYGNWTEYIPAGSKNYERTAGEKTFCRIFRSKIENNKFGGTFIFEGITKAEFLNEGLNVVFSNDCGATWYDIKKLRDTEISEGETVGVLTHIAETNTGVEVEWAYPGYVSSIAPLWFKLSMMSNIKYTIKSISLRNIENTREW